MKKALRLSICFAILLLIVLFAVSVPGQTPAPAAIVIEGGTLIDGNGGAPVPDSVVVIQGNRIAAVSRKGQATYPPNAKIIKADGKFILPGLWDSQVSNSWYFAEPQLNHGVTSTIDVGTGGETSVPYRDAVMHGKLVAPRGFTGISRISSSNAGVWSNWTGLESPLTPTWVPKTVEETRAAVRLRVAAGADYIIFYDGGLPIDFYRAGFDEARKTNTPVFTRAYGPILLPGDAALLGSVNIPHSAGIGLAVTQDPSKWPTRDDRSELDRYAEMDDAKAAALVKVLVEHHTALVPTFMINFPGYPKDWPQFAPENRKLLTEPGLLAYYPAYAVNTALGNGGGRAETGAVRERRMKGFQNALRFHKMLIDAGGRVVVSGNTNEGKAPGLDLHHEMQILAEAGIGNMQIIQGSTRWAAELIGKQKILGTVEAGKLADVIVVDADPLQDIRNLDKINTVILNGGVVELGYHSWYRSPFNMVGSYSPTVEGLPWTAAVKNALRGGSGGNGAVATGRTAPVTDPANSPQPAIETIAPYMVTQGAASTITITGFNFVRRSQVLFDGKPVRFEAVSPTEIHIMLDAEQLRTAGRFDIVVKNPEPFEPAMGNRIWGNGTSNQAHLIVNFKYD